MLALSYLLVLTTVMFCMWKIVDMIRWGWALVLAPIWVPAVVITPFLVL